MKRSLYILLACFLSTSAWGMDDNQVNAGIPTSKTSVPSSTRELEGSSFSENEQLIDEEELRRRIAEDEVRIREEIQQHRALLEAEKPAPFLMSPAHIYWLVTSGEFSTDGMDEDVRRARATLDSEIEKFTRWLDYAETATKAVLFGYRKAQTSNNWEEFLAYEKQVLGVFTVHLDRETDIESSAYVDILQNSPSSKEALDHLCGLPGGKELMLEISEDAPLSVDMKKMLVACVFEPQFQNVFFTSQYAARYADLKSRQHLLRRWKLINYGQKQAQEWVKKAREEAGFSRKILGEIFHANESCVYADAAEVLSGMVRDAQDQAYDQIDGRLETKPAPGRLSKRAIEIKEIFERESGLFNGFQILEDRPENPFPIPCFQDSMHFFSVVQRGLVDLPHEESIELSLESSLQTLAQIKEENRQWSILFNGALSGFNSEDETRSFYDVTRTRDPRMGEILRSLEGEAKEELLNIQEGDFPTESLIKAILDAYGIAVDSPVLNGYRAARENSMKTPYIENLIVQLESILKNTRGVNVIRRAFTELAHYYEQSREYSVIPEKDHTPLVELQETERSVSAFIQGSIATTISDHLRVCGASIASMAGVTNLASMIENEVPLSFDDIMQDAKDELERRLR